MPQKILSEVSLSEFSKEILLSESTRELIRTYDARLHRMRVDFYVKGLVAIEVQGEQHEREIRFSNEIADTKSELERRKGLDRIKQEILNAAAIPFVCVWYYEVEDLTAEQLKEKIMAAQAQADMVIPVKTSKISKARTGGHVNLELLKLWRKNKSRKKISSHHKHKRNMASSSSRLRDKPMGNSPFRKNNKGQSKLSWSWEQYKKQREEDNG